MSNENVASEKLMTVGEIAKAADVSVRTIQYYDQCNILKATDYSEGGFRLYSNKDLVMVYQIKSLKHMGLTLNEIKKQLVSLDDPEKVLSIVRNQKEAIIKNIESLQDTLEAIEFFEDEITVKNRVDFAKYAQIITDVKHSPDSLWFFVDIMEKNLQEYINKIDVASRKTIINELMNVLDEMIRAQKEGIKPRGKEGEALGAKYWQMVEKFLSEVPESDNSSLMSSLTNFADNLAGFTTGFAAKWNQIEPFVIEAIDEYFTNSQRGGQYDESDG
ncbi:MAG: MerR family transcriptional regulator [Turicibacter sp.]|nr:MerR family transcriptional regulator [Turicibacter sp.]